MMNHRYDSFFNFFLNVRVFICAFDCGLSRSGRGRTFSERIVYQGEREGQLDLTHKLGGLSTC